MVLENQTLDMKLPFVLAAAMFERCCDKLLS